MTARKDKTMKKHYYTKLRKLFAESRKLWVQSAGTDVYVTEGHVLVRMPDWLYREEFCGYPGNYHKEGCFPVLFGDEKLELEYGEPITYENGDTKEGQDIRAFWQKAFDNCLGDMNAMQPEAKAHREPGRNQYVRFCETETDYVKLNNRFYEAMEQATRGGLMYGGIRKQPVWFYDSPEIHMSALCGMVLPIMYCGPYEAENAA